MLKHPTLIALLIGVLGIVPHYSYAGTAQDSNAACQSLERPNIDCSCVETRMQAYRNHTKSALIKSLLEQRYAHALGLKSAVEEATKELMADPSAMLSAHMAYDSIGGLPENIEEFERGCVIKTSQTFEFSELAPDSSAAAYAEARTQSVGEDYRRESNCLAGMMNRYLSDAEFTAYQLSYSHYEGDHLNDDAASRASKMGVTRSEFIQLEKSARVKLERNNERHTNYCTAITYAESFSNQRIDDDKAQATAFLKSAKDRSQTAANSALSKPTDSTKTNQAAQLVQENCAKQGNSQAYCQCVVSDVDRKVVSKVSHPGVALAWVMMRYGAEMDSATLMQLSQSANPADQQEAALLLMSTSDVGENCNTAEAKPAALAGSPKERMMTMCLDDMEDATICACVINKMQSKLTEDDFELVVDLREADYRGAGDPLAVVANDRGLTREQAEEALGANKNLIGGMMNMDVLSCLGGMPDMSQLPDYQGQ